MLCLSQEIKVPSTALKRPTDSPGVHERSFWCGRSLHSVFMTSGGVHAFARMDSLHLVNFCLQTASSVSKLPTGLVRSTESPLMARQTRPLSDHNITTKSVRD